jgi:hypothetical protein
LRPENLDKRQGILHRNDRISAQLIIHVRDLANVRNFTASMHPNFENASRSVVPRAPTKLNSEFVVDQVRLQDHACISKRRIIFLLEQYFLCENRRIERGRGMSLFSNIFKPSRRPAEQDGLFSGKNQFIAAIHDESIKHSLVTSIQNDSKPSGPLKVRSSSPKLRKGKEERQQENKPVHKPVPLSDIDKPPIGGNNNVRKSSNSDEREKAEVGPTSTSKRRKTHGSEEPFPIVNEVLNSEKGMKTSSDDSGENASRSGKDRLSVQENLRLKRTVFVGNLPSVAVKKSKKLERLFSK